MEIIFISDTHTKHFDGWLNRELDKVTSHQEVDKEKLKISLNGTKI